MKVTIEISEDQIELLNELSIDLRDASTFDGEAISEDKQDALYKIITLLEDAHWEATPDESIPPAVKPQKTVDFISQMTASDYIPIKGEVLISVATPNYPQPVFQDGWEDILRLSFHDISAPYEDLVLFSEEDAKKVVEFANKHENCERFVVHCWMGVSRSSAIAKAISDAQGRRCPEYNYLGQSNPLVFYLIEEAFKEERKTC